MSVPTITSIAPAVGPVSGFNYVVITGTNFRLPLAQPATGPSVDRAPSVSVQIGLNFADKVDVLSVTQLGVRVPIYDALGLAPDLALPPVDVVVRNLDDSGVAIGGEVVTRTKSYTYLRPSIHDTNANTQKSTSPYTLISAALINLLRQQIFVEVIQTTHVDYSEPGVLEIALAKVPCVIIQGPTVERDTDYWRNEQNVIDNLDGSFSLQRPPFVAKLTYTIICVSDNEREIMNINGSLMECFERVRYLPVWLDEHDPTQGKVQLVLKMTSPPQSTNAPSESNIRTFAAVCEIRGAEIYESYPVDTVQVVTAPEIDVQQDIVEVDSETPETIVV